MFGLFQRPKLEVTFTASEAVTEEFTRRLTLAGELTLRNDGSDADLGDVEMMLIAGYRRIPLEVPTEWRAMRLARGARMNGAVRWALTLDAPLRAETGEFSVSLRDQKRKAWDWRLPFAFDRR